MPRSERNRDDAARERGVFMISVAAELAGVHPQTLRMYEQRGLITPQRSPKRTRLYSQRDVERLMRIQELTGELGMNLAGVERVFELEGELEHARRRMVRMEDEMEALRVRMLEEMEALRRSLSREIVPYRKRATAIVRAKDVKAGEVFHIPIDKAGTG